MNLDRRPGRLSRQAVLEEPDAAVPKGRGRARRLFPLALATLLLGAPAAAQRPATIPPPGNRVDYVIDARLDGETEEPKRVSGVLRLDWTNGSGEAVSDLWFHLYLNAFSNNRSTHLAEERGRLRGRPIRDGWGWSEVKAVRVSNPGDGGFVDVFPSFQYRRPDDGNPDDRTVFSVDAPQPIQPGAKVTVEIEWESQLPRLRRRTGYKDDFLLVAQWFPKLGVYEAGRGWNCHQFHANTEFYSDYGTYSVTLNLPKRFEKKVGASGRLELERLEGGERVVVRFVAPSPKDQLRTDAFGRTPVVHDFTWTADPNFIVRPHTFRFADWADDYPEEVERARRIFGPDENIELRDVDITLLIHPERESQIYRHIKATEAALFFYGLWFGEYPYEHITVVDPAWGARAAGGMEYPTLFTCGTSLFTRPEMHRPESVTVHECGHQFWYGLVGNNEFEASWLDEGFNSYTDSEVLWRVYGESVGTTEYADVPIEGVRVAGRPERGLVTDALLGKRIPMPWVIPDLSIWSDSGFLDWWRDQPSLTFVEQRTDPRWSDRTGYLRDPDSDPIETWGWRYVDRSSYGTNSYRRTAVALRSLPGVIGYDAFLRGLRHYAKTWRYRHPYPADFYRTFQEGAGVDVQWYFDELFRGTGTVDWSVEVEQGRRPEPRGFFQSEGGEFLELRAEDEDPEAEKEDRPWAIEVVVRRRGDLRLPLPVRLTFADGETRDELWSREEQESETWTRIELESDEKLVSVQLDPERSYYIDRDMSNNQWYDETDEVVPWRWSERVMAQYQRFFHWIGGIGG